MIRHTIKQNKAKFFFTLLFIILLTVQIVLWGYINIKYQFVTDHDSAKVQYHTMQIWENRAVIIPNWKYMTTLELDCSSLLGLPLYIITRDVVLSFAIANIVNVILFTCLLLALLKHAGVSIDISAIAVAFLLLPFRFGAVQYANMLFYASGQYIYKVLIPVWMIEIISIPCGREKKLINVLQTIAFYCFCFITAFSSGLYVFVCGLFPIILYDFLRRFILAQRPAYDRIHIPLITGVLSLAGVLLQKILHFETYADSMNLVAVSDFFKQLNQNGTTLLSLINALPDETVSLYSFGSILHVATIITFTVLFLFGVHSVYRSDQYQLDSQKNYVPGIQGSCLSVFLWNTVILQLTVPVDRYHLIGFIPLILSACIGIQRCLGRIREHAQWICKAIFLAVVSFLMLAYWWKAIPSLGNYYYDYYDELNTLAKQHGVTSIAYINDTASAEMARVILPEYTHVSYISSNHSLNNYDTTLFLDDRNCMQDRHFIVESDLGSLEELPSYIQTCYQKIGNVFNDTVYMAETCLLDGLSGPLNGYTTTDFPFTQGYQYDRDVDEEGFVWSHTDEVLKSPDFCADSSDVQVTIYYTARTEKETCAVVYYNVNDKTNSAEMPSDKDHVTFTVQAHSDFSFSVMLMPDAGIRIEKIQFEASENRT